MDKNLERNMENDAEKVLGQRSREDIIEWKNFSEKTAIVDMLWVFRTVGIFNDVNREYSMQEIESALNPVKEFEHIIRRWLGVLVKEGIIKQTEESVYILTEKGNILPDRDDIWGEFKRLEDRVDYSAILWEY